MPNLIGQSLGRYHLLEQLGEGGMATVYKAYDTRLERDVAVKIIRRKAFPEEQLDRILRRFEREAKALARLNHPNIVPVIDYGEYEGAPYLVMPYFSGGTLKERLGKPMPWRDAVQILAPIAEALDYAHGQHIVHRDVKPSNILLTSTGRPMLSDFGIAKILDDEDAVTLTGTGVGVGTPEYMAPEQWTGQAGPQSDIYSLGVVLYELVTGCKPYTADTPAALLLKQATEPLLWPAQFVPDLPVDVGEVLLKALAKNPRERYTDISVMARALDNLLVNGLLKSDVKLQNNPVFDPLPPQKKQEPKRQYGMIAGLFVLLALILAGGSIWLIIKKTFATSSPPIKYDQAYILEISEVTLFAETTDGISAIIGTGDTLEIVPDKTIHVADATSGYVEIVFPGQAVVFLAPGAAITLISSDSSTIVILLEKGRLLVSLPDEFPVGRKFVIQTRSGASAWVSGSMMGVEEDSTQNLLYVDCIEDKCWVSYGSFEQQLLYGTHAVVNNSAIDIQAGIDDMLWQYAPDLATPSKNPDVIRTSTSPSTEPPTATLTLTPSRTSSIIWPTITHVPPTEISQIAVPPTQIPPTAVPSPVIPPPAAPWLTLPEDYVYWTIGAHVHTCVNEWSNATQFYFDVSGAQVTTSGWVTSLCYDFDLSTASPGYVYIKAKAKNTGGESGWSNTRTIGACTSSCP